MTRVVEEHELATVADLIASARHVLVLTGAGVSAASGLPTYRGTGGIYDGTEIADLHHASRLPDSLPELWAFWGPRRRSILDAQPNPAHLAIADLQRASAADGRSVTLATQNIDDLHERAGSPQVAHLHGTLFATRCSSQGCRFRRSPDLEPYVLPPTCPLCGSLLRPDVVLFGERLDVEAEWETKRAVRETDVLLAVGTSGEVSTAAYYTRYAADVGAVLVTVDPAPLVPDAFQLQVRLHAELALPILLGTG
jgi:NAD-dependent deacetylase